MNILSVLKWTIVIASIVAAILFYYGAHLKWVAGYWIIMVIGVPAYINILIVLYPDDLLIMHKIALIVMWVVAIVIITEHHMKLHNIPGYFVR